MTGHTRSQQKGAEALADRIDATKRSWLPIAGHVVNITISLSDADMISSALRASSKPSDAVREACAKCPNTGWCHASGNCQNTGASLVPAVTTEGEPDDLTERLEMFADHGAPNMEAAQEMMSDALLEIRRLRALPAAKAAGDVPEPDLIGAVIKIGDDIVAKQLVEFLGFDDIDAEDVAYIRSIVALTPATERFEINPFANESPATDDEVLAGPNYIDEVSHD